MRVLVVEDEEKMVVLLSRGLKEEGHEVDVCSSGADAVEQAAAVPYDVVLLDWSLPDSTASPCCGVGVMPVCARPC